MIQSKRPIPATQIKLLLWDLDGTLVDSELDLAHSINAMLRHLSVLNCPSRWSPATLATARPCWYAEPWAIRRTRAL